MIRRCGLVGEDMSLEDRCEVSKIPHYSQVTLSALLVDQDVRSWVLQHHPFPPAAKLHEMIVMDSTPLCGQFSIAGKTNHDHHNSYKGKRLIADGSPFQRFSPLMSWQGA